MARRPKITPAHRRDYLAHLAAGATRSEAARKVHKDLTGTAFRGIENREPKFRQQVEAAEREGQISRADRIDEQFDLRAFDPDRPNLRALEILAATHVEKYRWLRRGAAARGPDGPGGVEAAIDPDLLTREQLLRLIELVKMGQGMIPNPELDRERERKQLNPGVIEAEVIEEDAA